MKRFSMKKVKEVLRMKDEGFSYRDIALSIGCSKAVIGETLKRAQEAGIESVDSYTEEELEGLLFPPKPKDDSGIDKTYMEYLLKELGKKHVTRFLLWQEYKEEYPEGLMYSQFCEKIRQAKKANDIYFTKTHKGGEVCETDWAGTKIPYYDIESQEERAASLFVAALPASSYMFAYAYGNQKTESWIEGHIRAFIYYGGTPRILTPDCTKTAVTTSDLYEPVLNETYEEMARHYGIDIIPARPGKPQDKASVENAVGLASRQIIAALRNERFTSIKQINEAIEVKLAKLVEQPFQKMAGCRRSAFEQIDKPALRPLPKAHYELAYFKTSKIGPNYHVEYEGFFYSVPYQYRAKVGHIRATRTTIEVLVGGERVCSHQRKYDGNRYTTDFNHLPDNHQIMADNQRYIEQASVFGEKTVDYIKAVMGSVPHYVQAYRSCMGILREAEGVDKEMVEAASLYALERRWLSSKYFTSILKEKKDTLAGKNNKIIRHDNIRGNEAYKGGRENA